MRINYDPNSQGWQPLPEGEYIFEIVDFEQTVASTGTPQLKLNFIVVEGGGKEGKKASDFFALTEKAGWRLRALLNSANVEYEEPNAGEIDFDENLLPGSQFRAEVAVAKSNTGKTINRFNIIDPTREAPAAGGAQTRQAAAAPATNGRTAPAAKAAPAEAVKPQARTRALTPRAQ